MFLNCHTYYSLRYGTLSPKQLVEAAVQRGVKRLALTDINNVSAALEFVRLCEKAGIKPIVGIEFRQEQELRYIGLAKNLRGFAELNYLLTQHSRSGKPLPVVPPKMKNAYIIYPKLLKPIEQFKTHELLGVRPEHVHRIFSSPVRKRPDRLVVWNPVTILSKSDYELHQLLRAIDLNTLITKLTSKDVAKKTEIFLYPKALQKLYASYPPILENTQRIMDNCSIQFETGLQLNRKTFTGSRSGDLDLLRKLARNGCRQRYGEHHTQAIERVEKELKVIDQQDFCSYFLITWDIVRYAKSMNYQYVGRGSGANSIVAFCLHITDVDPLDLDLYFERFINPHRTSPPDFDIDFSWKERDDIIDYIFKRYGEHHTALLATFSTFRGKSIVRELGKVFGLPKAEIDTLIAQPDSVDKRQELALKILHYGKKLQHFPNYLSIHAGGILITEKPIYHYTALQQMPKGFPVTHFDMYGAEDWGLHKFDVLSQRGLGNLRDAVDLIRQNQGKAVDIHDVAAIKQDKQVKQLLRRGKSMGCFYIESPAMRQLLQKLKCDTYVHLVAASSIIRPGVAQSGMMREYIHRFHNPYSFEYLHPIFAEHLGETFGVMVYQEDVMKIMHHFAGLDLDESDVLRRIMSGKKYQGDTFERLKAKYFANCKQRGYPEQLTQEVWRQIESFSGYSFCKAHSASFAVESFQSLYLKAYYPLEYMVAVINNFGGFYATEYYFHEARMLGGSVHAPCINHSRQQTTLYGKRIYIGFGHLHKLEQQVGERIIRERDAGGNFKSLVDFLHRVDISSEQLDILIRIGAFRFTGKSKYELMWEKNGLKHPKEHLHHTGWLFDAPTDDYELPELEEGPFDQAFDELELLGFPLCSPFDLLDTTTHTTITTDQLQHHIGKQAQLLGYYVCKKDVRTKKGQIMHFGCWLDRQGQFFDTVHFPNRPEQVRFLGKGIYRLAGKVVGEFGFHSLDVREMERLPWRVDERWG